MSGLDGLRTVTTPVFVKDERGEYHPVTTDITWVKRDDVRDWLLSEETAEETAFTLFTTTRNATDVATFRDQWLALRPGIRETWRRTAQAALCALVSPRRHGEQR